MGRNLQPSLGSSLELGQELLKGDGAQQPENICKGPKEVNLDIDRKCLKWYQWQEKGE